MGEPRDRLLRSALALAQRKAHVLPCSPGGKTPATAHGLKDATIDPAAMARWWAKGDYNIGIATGRVSGFFVVDVDGHDGEAALRSLERENGAPLPQTVEVITGGGGRHLYFSMPSTAIANSVGKIAPHIDVRGDGGYVLAPPSVHPSGRRYAWSVDSGSKIAEAPAWLLAKIVDYSASNGATPSSEWHRLATDGVAEGARNDSIAKLSGHLLRRYVDPWVALELIRTWKAARCRPPLADKEIQQILNSIAGKELKRRQEAGHGR